MRGNAGNITPSGEDKTHVNDTELNRDRTILYSSDDFGLINAFHWPNPSIKDARSWCGHSEHVSRLAMTPDGSRIFSIGGEDKTLIQWKVKAGEPVAADNNAEKEESKE